MVPEWLSVSQAARRLGVSPDEVRERIKAGELKVRRSNGRQVVLMEAEGWGDETDSAIIVQALIAELRGQIAAKEEQLKNREQEIQRLSEQARAKDQQIERLMVLLAQSQAQTQELAQRLLPAPPPPWPAARPDSARRRRWWPFGGRA